MASQINGYYLIFICECRNLFLPVSSVTTPSVNKNQRGFSFADHIISDTL